MRFEVVNSNQAKKGIEKCMERIGKLYSDANKSIVDTPTCSLYLSTGNFFFRIIKNQCLKSLLFLYLCSN